jgi:hypothetical protein
LIEEPMMSLPDPTLDEPAPPPHTQPVVTAGALAELRARIERLERGLSELAMRLPSTGEERTRSELVEPREPGALAAEHVMELVQEYAFVFGCHESAVAPKRDALRAAVEKLARGEDPR